MSRASSSAPQTALEFTLARERYAPAIDAVQEVAEVSAVLRVPKAPPVIAGLVDVRGRVVTLVDLLKVFGSARPAEGAPVALILASPDGHIGLLVRGQPQVTRLDLAAAEPADGLIDGVLSAEERVYNIVNPRRILAYCEQQVLDAFKLSGAEIRLASSGRQA